MQRKILFYILSLSIVSLQAYGQKVAGQNSSTQKLFRGKKETTGALFTRNAEQLRLAFVSPKIVHIQYVPQGDFKSNKTDICLPRKNEKVAFAFSQNTNFFILQSSALMVRLNKITGSFTYLAKDGKRLLAESPSLPRSAEQINIEKVGFDDSKNKVEKTANGDLVIAHVGSKSIIGTAWKMISRFEWQSGEALFGLGSHEEGDMNLRGKTQYLYQHNLKKSVPVLMSSKGYGLLFDAGSTMVFCDEAPDKKIQLDAVNQLDYYFMYGPDLDQVVGHYRNLTGKVQLAPRYAFGYIQSKERYTNPKEIDSIVTRFRSNSIPLDVIVQDWNYWGNGLWGHKKFDEKFYPNPKEMVTKVHQKNARFMLSIWPNVAGNESVEMGAKGFVLGRSVYDAFNPLARKMYWKDYVNKNLFSLGVDAWWCDSSEPVDGDWNDKANSIANNPRARYELNSAGLNELLGPLRANLFSLNHSRGIYENQRLVTGQKRVVNLTRSGFAGIHRYGTFIWNGDTKATWADFARWIPSGLNYMATGNPYWTIDAGAFFVKSKSQWFWKGDFNKGTQDAGYREFYVRTLQFATWLPMMRSHGTDFAREPWQFGDPGSPFYDSIISQINLRYRLLPYTYSVAAMVSNADYTMTRPLVFDFMKDNLVFDIKDQFMFGPSFMVCPVISPMYFEANGREINQAKTRKVYLPKHSAWFDFWTDLSYKGGQTVVSDAPIDHIPVFVKAGSIIPFGVSRQYSDEKPDAPVELKVYPGEDASFTIYQDEGDNYNYEKGQSATTTVKWDDKSRILSIGERKGSFPGMPEKQEYKIMLVSTNEGARPGKNLITFKKLIYTGESVKVKW
ncbi:glycoside hydrolase family 31 protein [Pedobacter rhizosphaerae]|uniref:Alpha-D-xyloside xylohydrolase n=1 Tax=Pedobacter rhizosphaerae TaxID=390241 RepID=A0A1H9R1W2_9SPHI|nr:TIM-barrel domain-containing protein [Pedobacter rhizosphaerae]SER66688.1 alpha-D-xyloside xylohydrolase [Pedobacter rhizosphaerae]